MSLRVDDARMAVQQREWTLRQLGEKGVVGERRDSLSLLRWFRGTTRGLGAGGDPMNKRRASSSSSVWCVLRGHQLGLISQEASQLRRAASRIGVGSTAET